MASESPDAGKPPAEHIPPPPARSPVTDHELAGLWVLVLAVILPMLFARLPPELVPHVRYSYWANTAGIVSDVGTVALIGFLVWRTGIAWAAVGLVRRFRVTDVLAAAVMGVMTYALYTFAAVFLRDLGVRVESLPEFGYRPVGGLSWLLAVVRTITGAFAEELMYREYVFTRLERVLNSKAWAVLLASLLFGVCHLYQGAIGVLGATLFGLLTTVAFGAMRRLWPTTLAHAGYNLSLILMTDEPEVLPDSAQPAGTGRELTW